MTTIERLKQNALELHGATEQILTKARLEGRDVTPAEEAEGDRNIAELNRVGHEIKAAVADSKVRAQLSALGPDVGSGWSGGGVNGGYKAAGGSSDWSRSVAGLLGKAARATGAKDISPGQLGVPSVVEVAVQIPTRPARLLDLIPTKSLTANVFSYAKQVASINNAGPVADHAVKPTSTYTFVDVEDRAHVLAHITAPIALRVLADHDDLIRVIEDQMRRHLLEEIEDQITSGDGAGENFRGLLHTSGTLATAYATSIPATLRTARLQLEQANEVPTGWLMSPADLAALDLLMDNQNRFYGSDILSGLMGNLPRVSTTAMPPGTAILGDWSQSRLYVREEAELAVDTAGVLFQRNEAILRYESRHGFAVLKPGAFSVVDLTP